MRSMFSVCGLGILLASSLLTVSCLQAESEDASYAATTAEVATPEPASLPPLHQKMQLQGRVKNLIQANEQN